MATGISGLADSGIRFPWYPGLPMIAKRISIKNPDKSNFKRLAEYISRGDRAERVGQVIITNCEADTAPWAALEVESTQAGNTRAKSDKTYHLMISFRADEHPSPEVLQAVEERVCAGLGYSEHQRISAVHHDTDNLHIHIAINKIHPVRLTLHEPYYDHKKLGDLCVKLEREYGLQADNHQARNTGQKAADMEGVSGTESLAGWIKRECLSEMQAAKSWEELHRTLAGRGLELKLRGNGLIFTGQDGTMVKASSVSRELSKAKLEARLGPFVASTQRGPEPGPGSARGKQEEPAGESASRYQRRPLPSRVDTTELYARYQREQQAQAAARREALGGVFERKRRRIEAAKRAGRLKRAGIRLLGGGRLGKRLLYGLAGRSLREDLQKAQRCYLDERKAVSAKHSRQAWLDWLKAQALAGDAEALAALRARAGRRKSQGEGLTGQARPAKESAAGAEAVTPRGTAIYRVAGAAIRDDGELLRVAQGATQEGLVAALKMAMERYGERLTVHGGAEFKERIAEAAAASGLKVRFDDPALEKRRAALEAERRQRASQNFQTTGRSRR